MPAGLDVTVPVPAPALATTSDWFCAKVAVADLRDLGGYDWRLSPRNVWRVEKWLVDYPHRPLPTPSRHVQQVVTARSRVRKGPPSLGENCRARAKGLTDADV